MNVARSKHVLDLLQRGGGAALGGLSHSVGVRSVMIGGLNQTNNLFLDHHKSSSTTTTSLTRSFVSVARPRRTGRSRHHASKRAPPDMAKAMAMPLSCKEMDNSELVMLGAMGNTDALKEILVRHIMTVDKVPYETAKEKGLEIAKTNREGMWLLTLPYKVGIGMAITVAVGSFPMVFDINTVSWFNEYYVTADVPEPKDLETPLEVGSWAWAWMEPPLGQFSFFLLCLQYIRNQIQNLGIRPYTQKLMAARAEKLAQAYPQYDADIVKDFSLSVTFYHDKHGLQFGRFEVLYMEGINVKQFCERDYAVTAELHAKWEKEQKGPTTYNHNTRKQYGFHIKECLRKRLALPQGWLLPVDLMTRIPHFQVFLEGARFGCSRSGHG
ncbi:expressed unknown protein [Seminavis robusta]|uniref:Uncharacterized protein n=1 Tax=Seminavis robusta TaxID=568900 RepID=A0A9N8EJ04_9STRA|nr:expressed unknown protein [Seminavis robusta]|eukprot:Sro1255_g256500.1 n/a (383) ;mRNA; r:15426-16808